MVPELHHQSSGGSLSGNFSGQASVGTTNDSVQMLASSLKDRMKMVCYNLKQFSVQKSLDFMQKNFIS
jgi:hypothetical protein